MKIAIISDVHSNPSALLKALADAEQQGCGRVVCLGDLVGYGYDPNTCIDIIRERRIECLLGNHDAGLISRLWLDWFNGFAANAIQRQRDKVSEDNKRWLARLPYNKAEGEIAFAHGVYVDGKKSRMLHSAADHYEYIFGASDAMIQFVLLELSPIRTLFVGHTHAAGWYAQCEDGHIEGSGYLDLDDEEWMDVSKNRHTIINVGSVGYPRNQPYSIYGIFDTETKKFKNRILPFDFEGYIEEMKKSGADIPHWVDAQKKRAEEQPIGFR